MTSRLLISLSLALFAGQKVCAQLAPAADFFNSGAQFYISNNVPAALERVEMGLKTYPDDQNLKKLEQLLKQQQQQNQQQQNQQSQQQQNDQQNKSDAQKKQDQPPPDQKKDSQQQHEEQKQADQKKADEQKQPESKKDSGDPAKAEKQDPEQGQPVKPGEMTPEEAKRLLDTQKGNEQLLQLKPENKPRDSRRPVKDW